MYQFSFFSGSIRQTTPSSTITLEELVAKLKDSDHSSPESLSRRTMLARAAFSNKDDKAYKNIKQDLPSVTFSGVFSERKDSEIKEYSNLVCLDFDHLQTTYDVQDLLARDENIPIVLMFISPSGHGLKVIVKAPSLEEHEAYYDALIDYFKNTYNLNADEACRNVSRACFLAWDRNCYFNPNYKEDTRIFSYKKREEAETPAKVQGGEKTVRKVQVNDSNDYKVVLDIAENVERGQVHLCDDYDSYFRIVSGISRCLGEAGRELARRICRISNKFDELDFDDMYTRRLKDRKNAIGIGSVVQIAHLAGIHYNRELARDVTPDKEIALLPKEGQEKAKLVDIYFYVDQACVELDRRMAIDGDITGIPAGFMEIDNITAGWQNSTMIVVAGRPSMGKTAFALSMITNIAMAGFSVCFFSLEMSGRDIAFRLLSAEAEIEHNKLQKGSVSEEEIERFDSACTRVKERGRIKICDKDGLTFEELREISYEARELCFCDIIVIDYMQWLAMTATGNSQQEKVQGVSRKLKALAKELDIPIIVLAQLNRECENRADKRPQLADLRDSGTIEQDADIVSFLHRPEYYGIMEDKQGNLLNGICQFIIAKNRAGECKTINLKFRPEFVQFVSADVEK